MQTHPAPGAAEAQVGGLMACCLVSVRRYVPLGSGAGSVAVIVSPAEFTTMFSRAVVPSVMLEADARFWMKPSHA
jgi:hypothetical protein